MDGCPAPDYTAGPGLYVGVALLSPQACVWLLLLLGFAASQCAEWVRTGREVEWRRRWSLASLASAAEGGDSGSAASSVEDEEDEEAGEQVGQGAAAALPPPPEGAVVEVRRRGGQWTRGVVRRVDERTRVLVVCGSDGRGAYEKRVRARTWQRRLRVVDATPAPDSAPAPALVVAPPAPATAPVAAVGAPEPGAAAAVPPAVLPEVVIDDAPLPDVVLAALPRGE
eukprot:TRINITY_DN42984_c0_g1_i1.p2 TRINITY_DN42984_c0_g1~~TRINITY_DN42984_c0_g1_i1.p2  ORF type:complete len:248 (+),score=83.68 TRINITY_DN42984_c0_g1_i1:69-746(+)